LKVMFSVILASCVWSQLDICLDFGYEKSFTLAPRHHRILELEKKRWK